jgi:hypothetical protein
MSVHIKISIHSVVGDKGIGKSDEARALRSFLPMILFEEQGTVEFKTGDGTRYNLIWARSVE